jgi:hypothetical protein
VRGERGGGREKERGREGKREGDGERGRVGIVAEMEIVDYVKKGGCMTLVWFYRIMELLTTV